jgi:hypothetical protein
MVVIRTLGVAATLQKNDMKASFGSRGDRRRPSEQALNLFVMFLLLGIITLKKPSVRKACTSSSCFTNLQQNSTRTLFHSICLTCYANTNEINDIALSPARCWQQKQDWTSIPTLLPSIFSQVHDASCSTSLYQSITPHLSPRSNGKLSICFQEGHLAGL